MVTVVAKSMFNRSRLLTATNLWREMLNMPKSHGSKVKSIKKPDAVSDLLKVKSQGPVTVRTDGSLEIKILAKPGAKHNNITGLTEEGVGIQVAAPPVDGEANQELIKYLSKVLAVRKSDITLDKGSKARNKVVVVDAGSGLSLESVVEKLKHETDS